MYRHPLLATLICALLLLAAPRAARAANILDNVPADALGFVVVRNLAATDAKVEQLVQSLQLQFPGPLAFLKAAAGVGDGLDPHGDLLLAALPGEAPGDRPQLAIWLPVTNYEQLIAALDGTPADEIAAVTIAGEDLLVAQHGEWALVMDPEQRGRLETTVASSTRPPPQVPAWYGWIHDQDVTVAILPSGLRAAWTWAALGRPEDIAAIGESEPTPAPPDAPPAEAVDDLFGPVDGSETRATDYWSMLREQARQELRAAPQLAQWASKIEAVACGVRLDAAGNASAGLRVAWQHDAPVSTTGEPPADIPADPPALFPTADYLVSASGQLPSGIVVAAAGAYARLRAESLRNDIQVLMDDEAIVQFQSAVERAAAEVTAAAVLTLPGDKEDGIYSNEFLALRVRAADAFVERVAEVVRSWNEMNKSDQDDSRVVFDAEKIQLAGRDATHYSVDMAQAVGAAAVPEVRPSMERLFGPGGKLRLIVVPMDEHTVLLAEATPEQAAPVVDLLTQGQPIRWDERTERTNQLLPRDASWRLMASPHGRTRWLKRQMDAMLGPVIGGPIVHQFPPSPPIGAAGGFSPNEFWIYAAVPAETIHAAGQYLHER